MVLDNPQSKLFLFLSGLFISSILLAELIGVKLFSLEETLGFTKFAFTILGEKDLSLTLSVGVLVWPIIFILTDIINDYYGFKAIKFLTIISVIHIAIVFVLIFFAIKVSPDNDWWNTSQKENGILNMSIAFNAVFGQGLNIIIASIIAFLIGQIIDAFVFKKIKQKTGNKFIWARATTSTLISQFIDSIIVTIVAFYALSNMPLNKAIALAITAYFYKFIVALLSTPLLYFIHFLIEKYLGKELALKMKSNLN
ncbi:MAG: queuosine precursor transporter [Solirubrobacteraceae bacterium]